MRILKIMPLATFVSAAALAAVPASAGRTVIDGGISATLSGYCSPVEAAVVSGGCAPVSLPFGVLIGTQTYNSIYVNSNGTLSFNSIAPQLALQNTFPGSAPASSLGAYAPPIFSPNFVDDQGFAIVNFSGPSPGYDGTFASTQTLSGNSLSVSFFRCTTTVACGPATINAIANAVYNSSGFGLTQLIITQYSPNVAELSEANFELGRANALAQLNASLAIYTITLTGLSDGFSVDYSYNQGALGDIGTSGFNLADGLNETTAPLVNRSFRFVDGQLVSGAVPEPSTWATMLLGFGAVGVALRRRKAGRQPKAA